MHNNKRIRQYVGILSALIAYYFIHEGAHLLYALGVGAFKEIHYLGAGLMIDIYRERMSDLQLGLFCLAGPLATFIASLVLILLTKRFCSVESKLLRAICYYTTICFLLLDPIYLSVICGFVGGGDMNGIKLLIPELAARIIFGLLFVSNLFLFVKYLLPQYKASFAEPTN